MGVGYCSNLRAAAITDSTKPELQRKQRDGFGRGFPAHQRHSKNQNWDLLKVIKWLISKKPCRESDEICTFHRLSLIYFRKKSACIPQLLLLDFPLQIISDNEWMHKTQIIQNYYFANWVSFYPVQEYLLLMEIVEVAADVKTVLQSIAEVLLSTVI